MTDRQTHTQTLGIHRGGGSREWSILIPKLLAIARSLDKFHCILRHACQKGDI
jgi:hypothetical protein